MSIHKYIPLYTCYISGSIIILYPCGIVGETIVGRGLLPTHLPLSLRTPNILLGAFKTNEGGDGRNGTGDGEEEGKGGENV